MFLFHRVHEAMVSVVKMWCGFGVAHDARQGKGHEAISFSVRY